MSEADIVVIYHGGNCHDGFLSAYTVWKYYNEQTLNMTKPKIEFFPAQHNSQPPDVSGKKVYLLDMIFPLDILNMLIEESASLLIIDHHNTSESVLNKISDVYKIFDVSECCATLTWEHFYPDKNLPLLYEYVRSRDLFLNDREYIEEFDISWDLTIRNSDGQFDFSLISPYLQNGEVPKLLSLGCILNRHQRNLISKVIRNISFCPLKLSTGKLVITGYINTSMLANDIGSECLKEYPFLDFCACFYVDSINGLTQFQLRSTDDREDVSVIAKEHGGGGHRNSAGARIYNTQCKLSYEHLNPLPLICLYNDKELKVSNSYATLLTPEYRELLKTKFPNRALKISLNL